MGCSEKKSRRSELTGLAEKNDTGYLERMQGIRPAADSPRKSNNLEGIGAGPLGEDDRMDGLNPLAVAFLKSKKI